MQHKSYKTLLLNEKFGQIINNLRISKDKKKSRLKFCYEYDLDAGNLSRIENGLIDPKLSMLWRLSNSLEIPLSEIFKKLENELGENFNLMDE